MENINTQEDLNKLLEDIEYQNYLQYMDKLGMNQEEFCN